MARLIANRFRRGRCRRARCWRRGCARPIPPGRPAPRARRPRHRGATCRRRAAGDVTTARGFGRQVDRGRELARRAGQAAIGDQCHPPALVLQHAQQRRQRMQLGHAVGARALVAHHGDEVARQGAGRVQSVERLRGVDDHGGRGDASVFGLHRRELDQRAAEVAAQQPQPPLRLERAARRAYHGVVDAVGEPGIGQRARAMRVRGWSASGARRQSRASDGGHQLAEHEGDAPDAQRRLRRLAIWGKRVSAAATGARAVEVVPVSAEPAAAHATSDACWASRRWPSRDQA